MRYYYNTYDPVWGLNNIVNDLFDTWSDNGRRFPPVDVYETDNAYVIEMEVAGYDEEKISMHVEKHILSVKSDEVKSDEDKEYYAREIFTPAFSRSFALPENVDEDKISADYKNGILLITVPKKAEAQPKRIEVKISTGCSQWSCCICRPRVRESPESGLFCLFSCLPMRDHIFSVLSGTHQGLSPHQA